MPHANLANLDPIWSTQLISRTHGFLVYDTLYGTDADLRAHPQMAEGHTLEEGGTVCTVALREGLRFHDGEPVLARDCVASLQRWMRRSPVGQTLGERLDALEAPDDRRLVFRLKRPFPHLITALGSVASPVPFIMAERHARTDPFRQVTEVVGSGPFRFRPDEFVTGSLVVYERNSTYVPAPPGAATSLTAGPKVTHLDRVEWRILPDAATAAAALQAGEVDWYESPSPEVAERLRRHPALRVERVDRLPYLGLLRFNHLHAPFDDARARRALLPAVAQADFMTAIVGSDPGMWRDGAGVFPPGTPYASDAGLAPLKGTRDLGEAKRLLREAGYDGRPVRLIGTTEGLGAAAATQVAADLFRRLGLNLDLVVSDTASWIRRRTSREPLERGGWSAFCTVTPGFEMADPASHAALRGNGLAAWPGWPTSPRIEALREAWLEAPDTLEQERVARQMQDAAMEDLPFVPLGAYWQNTALRRDLVGRVSGFPIFWGIRRT
nr:ABC transporter substrate-binding protein [Belnapia mucosa]